MARADPVVQKPCGCVVLDLLSLGSPFVGLAGPGRWRDRMQMQRRVPMTWSSDRRRTTNGRPYAKEAWTTSHPVVDVLSMSSRYPDQSRSPEPADRPSEQWNIFLKDEEVYRWSRTVSTSVVASSVAEPMQANAGIGCPMHLASVGDFSLACSSVKTGVLART